MQTSTVTTSKDFRFYLGTHKASHLATAGVPLFVSHRTLRGRKTMPRAAAPWALDSGGFTEINLNKGWTETPEQYVAAVRRYATEIGNLAWAAPQDWMCEGSVTELCGNDVRLHQLKTVANFLKLRALAPELPFIPVLQGWWDSDKWTRDDNKTFSEGSYTACIEMYERAGVNLADYPVIGIGSVCRKGEAGVGFLANLMRQLQPLADKGCRFHLFGFKHQGLEQVDGFLAQERYVQTQIAKDDPTYCPDAPMAAMFASSDSTAWSMDARSSHGMTAGTALLGCQHGDGGKCNNCLRYALLWRQKLLASLPTLFHADAEM